MQNGMRVVRRVRRGRQGGEGGQGRNEAFSERRTANETFKHYKKLNNVGQLFGPRAGRGALAPPAGAGGPGARAGGRETSRPASQSRVVWRQVQQVRSLWAGHARQRRADRPSRQKRSCVDAGGEVAWVICATVLHVSKMICIFNQKLNDNGRHELSIAFALSSFYTKILL